MVPEYIHPEYIPRRLKFFQNLVKFAIDRNYDSHDVENFRKSLIKLEQIAKSL